MFALDALVQEAPIPVLARTMEAKLQYLRKRNSHFEHTAWRTFGSLGSVAAASQHQLLRSPMLGHPAELRLLWSLSALESQTELRCSAVAAAKRQSLQVAVARFWMGGLCSGSRFIQRKALGHWSL